MDIDWNIASGSLRIISGIYLFVSAVRQRGNLNGIDIWVYTFLALVNIVWGIKELRESE